MTQETRGTGSAGKGAVVADPQTMGGIPVFRGTRVPIQFVLDWLDSGTSLSSVRESYPFVTEELVRAARAYVAKHGKHRASRQAPKTWRLVSTKTVRNPMEPSSGGAPNAESPAGSQSDDG